MSCGVGMWVGWALGAVVCRRPGSVCQRGQALGACQALARACRPLSVRPRIAPNRTATGASTGRSLASGRRGEATEQFSTCYERWRSLLWQGCVAAVIKELKELHASGRYTDKQCYDIQGEINCFTENKERMDYPLYRSVLLADRQRSSGVRM